MSLGGWDPKRERREEEGSLDGGRARKRRLRDQRESDTRGENASSTGQGARARPGG